MRWAWARWFVIAGCAALAGACGGKVLQPQRTGSGAGGAGPDGGSSTNYNNPSHALGDCHPGTALSSGTPCPWLGDDGLCYPNVDAACNCVCPRDHASVCVAGFPGGSNGRVPVSCN